MAIYVQSRGSDRDKDYRWIQVLPNNSVQAKIPPLSKETILLLHHESPSLVIERLQGNRLLLLLTRIETDDRVDFLARPIRIDLAWVMEDTEENARSFRYLTTRALNADQSSLLAREIGAAVTLLKDPELIKIKNEYLNEIQAVGEEKFTNEQDFAAQFKLDVDEISDFLNGEPIHYKKFVAICKALAFNETRIEEIHQPVFDDRETEVRTDALEYGFQVSRPNLLKLLEVPNSESFSNNPPDTTKKIGKNIPLLRNELAEELQQHSLPSQQGALVIVTGFQQRETLEQAGVWRSLAEMREIKEDVWENVSILPQKDWEDYWKTLVPMPFSLFILITEKIQKVWRKVTEPVKSSGDRTAPSDSSDRHHDDNLTGGS
jgi:hypothetical protein